jgi:hypothetical protein
VVKIFALGGYGKVGFPAIKLLAQNDLVTEIAVAGRNLQRAEKAATEIGEKASAVQADGTNEQELASRLEGYDIIMNAALNNTVLPAIHAAIRTGTHYCDVNVRLVEQALQLASEVEAAGVTAIVATGIQPCISNLMGMHAAHQLDDVKQLQIGFGDVVNFQTGRELTPRQWIGDPKENLASLHECRRFIVWIFKILQKNGIRMAFDYRNGHWVETDPIKSGTEAPTQQGGTITSYPYASCDLLWPGLPDNIAAKPSVEMFFSPLPPQLHDLLRDTALRMMEECIDPETAISSFYDTIDRNPSRWLTLPDDFVPISKMWTRAVGIKERRPARFSCWLTASAWDLGGYFLIGAAQAVAVLIILRGEIRERGVMFAENTFEPLPFLGEVAALMPSPLPNGRLIGESLEWLE